MYKRKLNNSFYIIWYTKDSFIFRMINMIIRLSNNDLLILEENYEKLFALRYYIYNLT